MHVRLDDAPPKPARVAVPMTEPHLSVATIAAYVDDTLDTSSRGEADRHLAVCADCRSELAGVTDLVAGLPSPARRNLNWGVVGSALLAAGLVAILVKSPAPPPERSGATERAARPAASKLEILEPPVAGGLRNGRIVWGAVESRATYRVTVIDTTGATRWSAETTDTVATLPPSVRLETGARYYLYVEAQRSDGWSLQSGPRAFMTAP
jgi:anti-sigma factor RsiW